MFRHSLNASSGDFEPSRFCLVQNYPNPFRERTVIKYCVAYRTRVQLTLYSPVGEELEKLVDEEKEPGTYEVEFQLAVGSGQLAINQKAESGEQKAVGSRQLASHFPVPGRQAAKNGKKKAVSSKQKAGEDQRAGDEEYFYRMEAGDYSCEKKMIHRP